jgi:hypothetical protein
MFIPARKIAKKCAAGLGARSGERITRRAFRCLRPRADMRV